MVSEIKIMGWLFILCMLYFTYLYFRKGNYPKGEFAIWAAVWVGALVLLTFPSTVSSVVQQMKFTRTFDLYVSLAMMFILAVTFFNYASVRRQERRIEDLVRAAALRKRK